MARSLIGMHLLRHMQARRAIAGGRQPKVLQRFPDHSSIQMIRGRYVHDTKGPLFGAARETGRRDGAPMPFSPKVV